ncbi:MAG: hypothetical protein IKS99_08605 [Firmicutes bacterium]|nr:hypothetical protein [Bacillota bacterium]
MTRQDFYDMLDIETVEDFKYVENVSQYLECDDEIEFADIAALIKELDKVEASGLIDDYFEEIMDFIPEAETEMYSLFTNIRRSLTGMFKNADEVSTEAKIAEELERFRRWYSMDSKVYLQEMSGTAEREETVRDALFAKRMESLGGEKFFYDFTEAMDYPLEEYVMTFGDMMTLADDYEVGEDNEE